MVTDNRSLGDRRCLFSYISLNAQYVVALFQSVNPLPYIRGEVSREKYLGDNYRIIVRLRSSIKSHILTCASWLFF